MTGVDMNPSATANVDAATDTDITDNAVSVEQRERKRPVRGKEVIVSMECSFHGQMREIMEKEQWKYGTQTLTTLTATKDSHPKRLKSTKPIPSKSRFECIRPLFKNFLLLPVKKEKN